jgi:hypothetical protein
MLPMAAMVVMVGMLVLVKAVGAESGGSDATAAATGAAYDAAGATADAVAKTEPAAGGKLNMDVLLMLWLLAPLGSIVGIIAAWVCYKKMIKSDPGSADMQRIAGYVRQGARAYLKRQYKVVAVVFAIMFVFFCVLSYVLGVMPKLVPFAFLTGGLFSGLCGWIGMNTATLASNRTAAGAKESLNRGLRVAFQSGAVMGMIVVGFGLLDICLWFAGLYWLAPRLGFPMSLTEITVTMLCFGMGASLQALFARVGGASSPRPPTSAPTWSARSRPAYPRTIRATRRSSPTTWATTWATWPVWARTFTRATAVRFWPAPLWAWPPSRTSRIRPGVLPRLRCPWSLPEWACCFRRCAWAWCAPRRGPRRRNCLLLWAVPSTSARWA